MSPVRRLPQPEKRAQLEPERLMPMAGPPVWSCTGDPAQSDVCAVRFEIQDTDQNAALLQDAEIAYAILRETGQPANTGALVLTDYQLFSSAARCCEALARLFAAQADEVIGDVRITYSKQAAGYSERAKELRTKAAGMGAPYSGGQSRSEKESRSQDTDKVQPAFRRRSFENPFAGSSNQFDGSLFDGPLDG